MNKNWLSSRSKIFSTICRENVSKGEVISVHVGMLAMLLMGALVNAIGNLF